MSKRILAALLLLLALSLCACAGKETPPEASSQPPAVSVIVPEPEPEPEPEPLPYVNPLTGEGCETDIGQNRPIAIMLNNLKKALPQLGVSQADIIYEAPAEGGITRMMAVFQSVEGVGDLGSVRSARGLLRLPGPGPRRGVPPRGGQPSGLLRHQELGRVRSGLRQRPL